MYKGLLPALNGYIVENGRPVFPRLEMVCFIFIPFLIYLASVSFLFFFITLYNALDVQENCRF
jgi:hypothetical protein